MTTDTRIDHSPASRPPEPAWWIVGVLGTPLAVGWLWLASKSPLAWFSWICIAAMFRYWHGTNAGWTPLARILSGIILVSPIILSILIGAGAGGAPPDDEAVLISLLLLCICFVVSFLLWRAWDQPENWPDEAVTPVLLLAIMVAVFVSPVALEVVVAASLLYCLYLQLSSELGTASTGGVVAGLLLSVGLAGVAGYLGDYALLMTIAGCIMVLFGPKGSLDEGRSDATGDAEPEADAKLRTAPRGPQGVSYPPPRSSAAAVVISSVLAVLVAHDSVDWGFTPLDAAHGMIAGLFALGLWLLPAVLGRAHWLRARHLLAVGVCRRDLHRLRTDRELPWPVRWTGGKLYMPLAQEDQSGELKVVCRHCGGQDIVIARRRLGVIGALPGTPDTDDERRLPLYDPATGRAITVDIDRLDLYPPPAGTTLDWDHAINAVVNALTEDHDRTHPLERIPVRIHAGLMLPENARRVLTAHFGLVYAAG